MQKNNFCVSFWLPDNPMVCVAFKRVSAMDTFSGSLNS